MRWLLVFFYKIIYMPRQSSTLGVLLAFLSLMIESRDVSRGNKDGIQGKSLSENFADYLDVCSAPSGRGISSGSRIMSLKTIDQNW